MNPLNKFVFRTLACIATLLCLTGAVLGERLPVTIYTSADGNVPYVLLSDIGLPGMNGIEGIRKLNEEFPRKTVLVITVYDDERIFDALYEAVAKALQNRIV